MKKYGLIGCPLGHSMSPVIHKQLFLSNKIEASYNLIEIDREKLFNDFSYLKEFDGFNVTIPHKINIIEKLDGMSDRARLFGAVNTVNNENGKMIGYNTDCHGFLRSLKIANIDLCGDVLILGCGGVARMFAFESVLAKCNVTIAVRDSSTQKANILKDEIKQKLGVDVRITTLNECQGKWDLIINGTPVGMYPNVDECPVDREVVENSKAVFDAIYNPKKTKFIEYAKDYGIKYSNGLAMLVLQAAVAQEIWYGAKFNDDDIKRVIEITQRELDK